MALPKEQTLELLEKSRDMYGRILHYRIYQYGRDMIQSFLKMDDIMEAQEYFFMETERICQKVDFFSYEFDKFKELIENDKSTKEIDDNIEDTFHINRNTIKDISPSKEHKKLLKIIDSYVKEDRGRLRAISDYE